MVQEVDGGGRGALQAGAEDAARVGFVSCECAGRVCKRKEWGRGRFLLGSYLMTALQQH